MDGGHPQQQTLGGHLVTDREVRNLNKLFGSSFEISVRVGKHCNPKPALLRVLSKRKRNRIAVDVVQRLRSKERIRILGVFT